MIDNSNKIAFHATCGWALAYIVPLIVPLKICVTSDSALTDRGGTWVALPASEAATTRRLSKKIPINRPEGGTNDSGNKEHLP